MNFKYFQIQKWMLKAGRAEKVDVKVIYIYAFERSCFVLSENVIIYHAMT